MGYTLITTTNELKLDHERTCDNCGKQFRVVFRIFGKGASSYRHSILLSLLGSDNSRKSASIAETDALIDSFSQIQKKPCYHRCTHCGFYSKNDMEMIRVKLRKSRKIWHGPFSLLGRIALLSGTVTWWAFFLIFITFSQKYVKFKYIFLLFLSAFIISIGWYFYNKHIKYLNKNKIESLLRNINNPEIIEKWLSNWKKNSNNLLLPFLTHRRSDNDLNIFNRQMAYSKLYKLQHKFDP
ncbi:hypothetical protein JW926_02035 [Candidatus Sumerlaeota bacterium]|nr:hypothetical protein [Candidatus Sumerlaeota bacterium]